MKPLLCLRVGALLARRAAGLTDSERLEVDGHRADCPRCDAEAKVLAGIRSAVGDEPILTAQARELLLRRAFELAPVEAGYATSSAAEPLRHWRWATATLVAVACTAALLIARPQYQHLSAAATGDHLLSGSLSLSGRDISSHGQIPAETELSTGRGAAIAVGNAEVELAPGSSVVWKVSQSTLELRTGRVRVAVEHQEQQRFYVATASFLVEVVGTRFEVDAQGVKVTRGTVRVLSVAGRDVLAVLSAGGAWSAPLLVRPAASAAVPAPAAAVAESPRALAPPSTTKETEANVSVAQWLGDARRALATHRIRDAQRAIDAALHLRPTAHEMAEARTLQAECAGASGDGERAVRLYLSVADQFSALPAAENALFAAARTQARLGPPERARRLFEKYLQRYPAGRFRREAESHVLQAKPALP